LERKIFKKKNTFEKKDDREKNIRIKIWKNNHSEKCAQKETFGKM